MSPPRPSPTTGSYRAAVRAIMNAVQRRYDLNDVQLADRIGCSASTVRNAKGKHTNLDGVTLATIEQRFGSGSLDPFLALGGSRATPLPNALPDIDPVLDIVAAMHRLIEAQHSTSEHGYLITSQELLAILRELKDARIAFDTLIALAQPGLATAPSGVQRWFRDTFEHPQGKERARDIDHPSRDVLGSPPPRDFVNVAIGASPEQLAERYGVPDGTIQKWLRMLSESLLADLEQDQRSA